MKFEQKTKEILRLLKTLWQISFEKNDWVDVLLSGIEESIKRNKKQRKQRKSLLKNMKHLSYLKLYDNGKILNSQKEINDLRK